MRKAALRCGLLMAALFAAGSIPGAAMADRAFGPRFTVNTQGDIAIAANSIMSCLDALPACRDDVRDGEGTGLNNNDRTLTWIDLDGDPTTFDSSSADLALPPGARVLFAGLYYGGKLSAGSGGSPAPSPGARNTVRFKAPGDTAYRTVTASQVDESSTQYQGFANVTAIVDGAGAGTYWTANVQLGTGLNAAQSGGWALVVAYGDPAAPSRNLSVFDGMQTVSSSPVTIPLSGFQTPLSGPVVSTVGIVAYEGDLGTLGDLAQIQGGSGAFTALSNAVNPGPPATSASNSNVFNATISNAGTLVTSREPSYRNNLGYDADLFRTTNVLGNGQTSTQVRLSTTGDAYQPGVVTITTDLYAPRIVATKSVSSATASLGDTLTYTVDDAEHGPGRRGRDDVQRPDPGGGRVRPGEHPTQRRVGDRRGRGRSGRVRRWERDRAPRYGRDPGGRRPPGSGGERDGELPGHGRHDRVRARRHDREHRASSRSRRRRPGFPSTVVTAPAVTRVLVPDLAIGKSHAPDLAPGQPSTYTITVGNLGEGPTSGLVTVTDTIEPPG